MLIPYIEAALRRAHYELLDEDGAFSGSIDAFPGVWASTATLEACRDELREILEEWIVLGLRRGEDLPAIDGESPTLALAA